MTYDPDNIFAKILRGEIPCVKVYEDDNTLAFMDVMPQAEGHTLVIPKAEAENIFDLDPDMAGSLIQSTQKIAGAVKRAMNCGGIMIFQLNGAPAGQTVFHIHFHVVPRNEGIDLGLHAREMQSAESLEPIAAKIRAELD